MFRKTTAVIAGLGAALGAGVMYLLDPSHGRRRRALVRDKLNKAGHETADTAGRAARDVKNRAKGLAHETRKRLEGEEVPDDVLVNRVRSELGHVVDHPGAVTVTALGGRVTLSGHVKPQEVETLAERLAHVAGVEGIENRLEVSENPGRKGVN